MKLLTLLILALPMVNAQDPIPTPCVPLDRQTMIDPGFEDAGAGRPSPWTFTGNASVVNDPARAHAGDSFVLLSLYTPGSTASVAQQITGLNVEAVYVLSFYWKIIFPQSTKTTSAYCDYNLYLNNNNYGPPSAPPVNDSYLPENGQYLRHEHEIKPGQSTLNFDMQVHCYNQDGNDYGPVEIQIDSATLTSRGTNCVFSAQVVSSDATINNRYLYFPKTHTHVKTVPTLSRATTMSLDSEGRLFFLHNGYHANNYAAQYGNCIKHGDPTPISENFLYLEYLNSPLSAVEPGASYQFLRCNVSTTSGFLECYRGPNVPNVFSYRKILYAGAREYEGATRVDLRPIYRHSDG